MFFLAMDDEAMFPMLSLRWPKVPNCRMLELIWIFMCVTWLQVGIHLDRFGPNFNPTWPIGANLGSSCVHNGAAWAQVGRRPGQVGPNASQFCGFNATCGKLAFLALFPWFFGFDVDQQMWGCEDVDQQMWGCEDVDQQMWRCEDVDQQMWGSEDVLQRLLFYEELFAGALGNKPKYKQKYKHKI